MSPLNYEEKIAQIKSHFSYCASPQERYNALMKLGRTLPSFPCDKKNETALVQGCQSQVYLVAEEREGKIYFYAESDALISAGLAALLVAVYSGETAQVIVTTHPDYLQDLGIAQSLTPGRAGGLASMHLHMKKLVLPYLLPK